MKKITFLLIKIIIVTCVVSCKKKDEPAPYVVPANLSYEANGVLNRCRGAYFENGSTLNLNASSGSYWPFLRVEFIESPHLGDNPIDLINTYWLDNSMIVAYAYQGTFNITDLSHGISGNFSLDLVKSGALTDTIHITEGVFLNLPLHY